MRMLAGSQPGHLPGVMRRAESVRALIEAAHNLQAAALVLRTPSQQLWAMELSRRVTTPLHPLQLV